MVTFFRTVAARIAAMRSRCFRLLATFFRLTISYVGIVTRRSRRMDIGASFVARVGVGFYRRYLSHAKGFGCAHSKLHNSGSCSEVAFELLQTQPLSVASVGIREQFKNCREAAKELNRRKQGQAIPSRFMTNALSGSATAATVGVLWMAERKEWMGELAGQVVEEAADAGADYACNGPSDSASADCDAGGADCSGCDF